MRYLRQFGIILAISFAGELLHQWIPLPVPASIYGIVILFLCLAGKVIPLEAVKPASSFLIEIMPVLFIPAAVGLMDAWDVLRPAWAAYLAITLVSTCAVMAVAGRVTQALLKRRKAGGDTDE